MNVVIRETTYGKDFVLETSREFKEFQALHARQPGYCGTIVARIDEARYLTLTLWETHQDMDAAREALTPVVKRLLDVRMAAPSRLLGTGAIVYTDIEIADLLRPQAK